MQNNKETKKDKDYKLESMADVNLFFGPSKEFAKVFKLALCTNSLIDKPDLRFNIHEEPIFAQILENMVLGQLQGLKDKARIKINDSCVLIGVIDEDGILEEGEVFI